MISNERRVVNPVNISWQGKDVFMTIAYCFFLSVLGERSKRSITSSNLVSARHNFVARNCCVSAAGRAFITLIHSFQFLRRLIEQEVN